MNVLSPQDLPAQIDTEEQLDELLTRPSTALVESIKSLSSPFLVLGAGGKMGPTLAVLAKRAAALANHPLEVIAVSRFSDSRARTWLEQHEVKTLGCDLLDRAGVEKLPETANLIHMVGLKFGTAQNPATTWAMNAVVPALVTERYPRARIVALSTGNVYPLTEVNCGGSTEKAPLTPLGEYPNSTIGRERIFEFYSGRRGTPVALLRLFYAVELRYGVLVDIARKVHAGEALDLVNGYFNCIWQGDAIEMIVRALSLTVSPPSVWNLCRPEIFSVREVAARFGELFRRKPRLERAEAPTALLGNAARICGKLGAPSVGLDRMQSWIAHWVEQGGRNLNKATHFEVRDGQY